MEREEQLSIPYKAVREAVLNSLAHRSYREAGGSVSIAIYDDRVEIENPGSLPPGWSVEKLVSEHNSSPQNPLIANVLYKRKFLESWGRGIKLIMDECRKADLPAPLYQTDATGVKLIFTYQGKVPVRSGHVAGQETGHVTGQETGHVTGQVMSLIRCLSEETLALKEIMEHLGLKGRDNFRKNYLVPAMEWGLVEQTHPENLKHRDQKYRLTEQGKALLQDGDKN